MSLPPVFMFGFERSGTTLLSMMVGAHPQIAVPLSVTGLWFRFAGQLERYNDIADRADLDRLVDDLLAEERIGLWDASLDRDAVLDGLEPGSYADVVRRFHECYARAKGKHYWANLDIATLDSMDVANNWFPDAKFVHIVRDGRDIALSHETMPYGAANTAECAREWKFRIAVSRKMGAMLGDDRYHVVRYEDLVLNSAEALGGICEFIGLPFAEEMLTYHSMVDAKIPDDKRWLWPALNKPPVKSKAYGWKKKMSPTKRAVFEDIAGDTLKSLGYEAYDSVPKSLSRYCYEFWCFLGEGGRFKRLARKLGINRQSKLERAAGRR